MTQRSWVKFSAEQGDINRRSHFLFPFLATLEKFCNHFDLKSKYWHFSHDWKCLNDSLSSQTFDNLQEMNKKRNGRRSRPRLVVVKVLDKLNLKSNERFSS